MGDDERTDHEQWTDEELARIERESRLLFDVDDEILLEWTVHPLVSRRDTTTRLIIFAMVAYVVAYFLFGPIGVMLSVVFTIIPGAPYVFPTRYVLTREGVHLLNWIARDKNRWRTYTSYTHYPDAVQLNFNRRSLRGWLLRGNIRFFDDDPETEHRIMDIVSDHLPSSRDQATS